MFIKDIRKEFYDIVIKKKVLVLVSYDVDAVCGLKILQFLFETDNVQYTAIPVSTVKEVVQQYNIHKSNINAMVLINVGATFDVVEDLDVDEGIDIFIADSHRPINYFNIYREDQVYLLMREEDNETVPDYEDVIDDEYESDDDNEEEEAAPSILELQRMSTQELERRKERRLQRAKKRQDREDWIMRSREVTINYYKFSYFGDSVADILFKLAWKLSRDSNQLLWCAIIGIFDQYVNHKLEVDKFIQYSNSLQSHVSRLSHLRDERNGGLLEQPTRDDQENQGQGNSSSSIKNQSLSIAHVEDLQLILYRHWSLYESIRHTINVSCRFKIWTPRGHKRLLEFLAELGIPLTQAKQKYKSMEMEFRENLQEWIEGLMEKYQLDNLVTSNFIATKGYKFKYAASDVALAVRALLESPDKGKSPNQKFFDALDSLSWSKTDVLEDGLELAKTQSISILKQVHHILDLNTIQRAGDFFYCILSESTPDVRIYSHPAAVMHLARFVLSAFVAKTKFKKADSFPLVLIVPDLSRPGTGLITGIPPLAENSPKNFFGEAFRQLNEDTEIVKFDVIPEFYDNCVARIPWSEKYCGDVIAGLINVLNS